MRKFLSLDVVNAELMGFATAFGEPEIIGLKPELTYPFDDKTITVTHCGRICMGRHNVKLSQVFSGQDVGVKEVSDGIWLVSFMTYDLGFFDLEGQRLEPLDNPFGPKLL